MAVEERDGRGRCAVAVAALPAGARVAAFSGSPYAAVPLLDEAPRVCAACFATAPAPQLRCSRCRTWRYCGPGCQKRDWRAHSGECRPLASGAVEALGSSAAAADALLLGRCLRRRAGEEDAGFDSLHLG